MVAPIVVFGCLLVLALHEVLGAYGHDSVGGRMLDRIAPAIALLALTVIAARFAELIW